MDNELIVKAYWFDQISDLAIAKAIIAKQQKEIAELRPKENEPPVNKVPVFDEPEPQF